MDSSSASDSNSNSSIEASDSNSNSDQYDYECKQRSLQRQARHQEKDYYRPVSPRVVDFTEPAIVMENLKSEDKFGAASDTVISWLERGECTKRNAGIFYSILQTTSNCTRQIQTDKVKDEEVLNETKKMMKKHADMHLSQLTLITKIHKSVSVQKNWDQFTKAQRKNIEAWRKEAEEMRNLVVEVLINEREEIEMELSDGEGVDGKNSETFSEEQNKKLEDVHKLCEENYFLTSEVEELVDHEEELKLKDIEIKSLRQALRSTQKKLLNFSMQHSIDEAQLTEPRALKRRREDKDDTSLTSDGNCVSSSTNGNSSVTLQKETHLIGLISVFLNSQPFGADIDYICSYLHQIDSTIKTRDVENLMSQFPLLFREDSTGSGASLQRKWCFTGFQP